MLAPEQPFFWRAGVAAISVWASPAKGEGMTIPSADGPPEERIGTTLDQFRQALTREVGRRNLGINISDERAAAIADDSELSARWYQLWLMSIRATPSPTPDTATPAPVEGAAAQTDDWQRQLPVRFNPPPGWPMPDQGWILQHIGLEMSDAWRPAGAPTDDPPGWMWWLPQNPQWTAWLEHHGKPAKRLRGFVVAAFVFLIITLAFVFAGSVAEAVLAGGFTLASATGAALTIAEVRHFRRDPLGELRDNHTQAAAQLNYGTTVRDGGFLDVADFISDFFDGE
ncbi:hypothetical protein GCM10009776_34730 [Microbacterium deminutum]|uniref:DUF1707 domain-containing protein n=2 Tax=Microbacterium deminutum TaxID=344164 RepID=A0ABN2RGS2_9MICO